MNEIHKELKKIMNILEPLFYKNFKMARYSSGVHNINLEYNSNSLKYYYYAKPCLQVGLCDPGYTGNKFASDCENGLVIEKEGLRYTFDNEEFFPSSWLKSSVPIIEEKSTYDIQTKDYDSSDAYFNLTFNYPDLSERMLRCIEFFSTNQVPNDIQIVIDTDMLSSICEGLSMFKEKIYANAR